MRVCEADPTCGWIKLLNLGVPTCGTRLLFHTCCGTTQEGARSKEPVGHSLVLCLRLPASKLLTSVSWLLSPCFPRVILSLAHGDRTLRRPRSRLEKTCARPAASGRRVLRSRLRHSAPRGRETRRLAAHRNFSRDHRGF